MTAPTITRPDHGLSVAQVRNVGAGADLPQARAVPTPIVVAPAGPDQQAAADHEPVSILDSPSPATDIPAGHTGVDAQVAHVGGEHSWNGSATIDAPTPIVRSSLADPFLSLAAEVVSDLEENRKANANRLGFLTRSGEDADGIERGLGMDERHPDVARLAALVDAMAQLEHKAVLNLNRLVRQHPLGPWIKAQKGVGDKQAARLLAIVGDPYINMQTGEPRTVSQLRSYCGHGDPTRRKRKGMTQADLFALGSPEAKMRVWNIAASCLKAQGHYADVYYARKDVTEGRLHVNDCVRCGPSGKPALAGSPWSDAHRHADALRIVGKEFLRDLWLEAKRLHESEAS